MFCHYLLFVNLIYFWQLIYKIKNNLEYNFLDHLIHLFLILFVKMILYHLYKFKLRYILSLFEKSLINTKIFILLIINE